MTRPSKREIEKGIDEVSASGEYSLHDLILASVKQTHDNELTAGEQQLLDEPEEQLSQTARRQQHRLDFDGTKTG